MSRTSTLHLDPDSLAALGPTGMTLAEAEGLEAHRRSVAIRLNSWDLAMSDQDDEGDDLQIWPETARLIEVVLDEASIGRNNAEVEHEREVAIFDLLEKNRFALEAHEDGPYTLRLSLADK